MDTIGIVAEYNPFHLGHAHQLSYLTERWPDALRIIVMSGSFVQRGTPAYFSKFNRAYWALLGGADIVIELPTVYALRSAEIFASGALRLMNKLGINAFSFGSEITNLDLLMSTAEISERPEVQDRIKALLKQGYSYNVAQRQAINEFAPYAQQILTNPNALLGLEYLRALRRYNLPLTPILIERNGNYHETALPELEEKSPSATALRKALTEVKIKGLHRYSDELLRYFPEEIGQQVLLAMEQGEHLQIERYYDLIHYTSRLYTPEQLALLGDFTEGIENRWKKASIWQNWMHCREEIKSKRYSYARIDRMAAYTVLHMQTSLLKKAHQIGPTYARLLGFTEAGRNWLRCNINTIPIVQKWAPFCKQATGITEEMAKLDSLATDIQLSCFANPQTRKGGVDYTYTPYYLKENV